MENEKNLAAEEMAANVDTITDVEAETMTKKDNMDVKDMISSIVIALFGLYVLISGVHMSDVSRKMSDTAWYGTPGILPIVIGTVLTGLSVVMLLSIYRKGTRINKEVMGSAAAYFKSSGFVRLAVAIGLLALYIFVLFRFLPFVLATFLYLAANMIFFREKKYPIWKIVLICAIFSVAIYLFFGKVAGVPLR